MKRYLISTIILFATFSFSSAQEIIEVTGKILDISTRKPVDFAHVINTKKGYANVSDSSGYFRILMTETDSIRISCIGYETRYWGLPKTEIVDGKFNTGIFIIPKTYEIATVNIYKMRWNAFVYKVMETEIEKDENQKQLQVWFEKIINEEELKSLYTNSRGVGFTIPFKTKQEKQLKLLEKIKREKELDELAEQKYNRELVHTITKLEGEELDKFMDYCRFERSFILQKSNYELIVIISEIYDIYKTEKM